MLSLYWRKGVESTMEYFDQHLGNGDYYLEDSKHDYAVWIGNGAARLGLAGEVTRKDFGSLTKNLNPTTGETLTARMNKDGNRRTWLDIAVSPPKDVSVLMALADDKTKQAIKDLHWESSLKTAKEMEAFLGRRLRTQNQDENQIGNCEGVMAAVLHETARPVGGIPDPHLHTHVLIANAVWDMDGQKWFAMQNSGLLDAQKYVRQFYYNELVTGLNRLGIATETRTSQNDFIISGLDRELVEAFARRHELIAKETDKKIEQGMMNRKDAADIVVGASREKKVKLSEQELTSSWNEIAGATGIQNVRDVIAGKFSANENFRHLSLQEGIEFAREHGFSNSSVLPRHEVARIVFQAARGSVDKATIQPFLENSDYFLSAGNLVTTKEVVREERTLISMVNSGNGQYPEIKKSGYVIPKKFSGPNGESFTLTDEQYKTITGVLENKNLVTGINGTAGAGKTTLLKQIEKGIHVPLVPLAPSGQARDILRKEGFATAQTLQQWLLNKSLQSKTKGAYIVVDEAGMISAPQMRRLLQLAKEHDNRVLLVGDIKQLQSVERGDAFRLLQQRSRMETYHVEETYRQRKNRSYKQAVELLRYASEKKNWSQCWKIFDQDLNCIHEAKALEPHLRGAELQSKLCNSYLQNPDLLIVASRWESIHRINEKIRDKLKKKREVTGGVPRHVLEPVQVDDAQKRSTATYQIGDYVELVRDLPDVGRKNELFKVTETKRGKVAIQSVESANETVFTPRMDGRNFTLHKPRVIEVGKGDTLLIKKNLSHSPLKNGMRVSVKGINEDGSLMVALHGDKSSEFHRLPANFRHYLHGYAVTAHASQGATVESVAVLADGMKKEQFYVAATRGKSEINIYTEDRYLMEQQVKVSSQRKSGIEVVETAQAVAESYMRSRFRGVHQKLRTGAERIVNHIRRITSPGRTNANRKYQQNLYYNHEHQNRDIGNYVGR